MLPAWLRFVFGCAKETDRNYGPFKTYFRCILDVVVQNRIAKGESTSLPTWIVGLVVFGGKDPVTDMDVHRNAFEDAFGLESNLNAWAKVGTVPCTRACLHNKQVQRELNDSTLEDETTYLMLKLDKANELSTYNLTAAGYNGSLLKVRCKIIPTTRTMTMPHSKGRILFLAVVSKHGAKFNATMVQHVRG